MKLTELQKILGEQVNIIKNDELAGEDLNSAVSKAQTIASLSKQMINNADIIIRFDKMKTLSPETQSRIEDLI